MRDTIPSVFRALIVAAALAAPAGALSLGEDNVLLLFNSRNAESAAIAQAYLTARPRVIAYDLDVDYPTVMGSQEQSATPPEGGMNNQFITPDRFEQIFRRSNSRFRRFLDDNPQILAFATTRGLPAAVSTNFKPRITADGDGIVGSFEAALANINDVPNSYFSVDADFEDFISRCGVSTPRDRMFLVSRLDSAPPASDADGDGDIDAVDGVIQLIQRSVNLPFVSKANAMLLADRHPSDFAITRPRAEITVNHMWDRGFTTYFDNTVRFLHGPLDAGQTMPIPDPCETGVVPADAEYFDEFDAPVTADIQTLALYTSGRNHTYLSPILCDGEPIHWEYVKHYDPHPAAVLVNLESFSGWRLHTFTGGYNRQGQSLWWIGQGASFAYGNVREPGVASQPRPEQLFSVLYHAQRTWAEAFMASLPYSEIWPRILPMTALGDPLGRPVVGDTDLDGDGAVTALDMATVSTAMLLGHPFAADINADGLINLTDIDLVAASLGRVRAGRPSTAPAPDWAPAWPDAASPAPLRRKGDLDGDGAVGFSDLNLLLVRFGSTCATTDVNGDGLTDFSDLLAVIVATGTTPADVNSDGKIDLWDLRQIKLKQGKGSVVLPRADLNGDGIIDRDDLEAMRRLLRLLSDTTR